MLKETETEETKVFFCDNFIIGSISIGVRERAPWAGQGILQRVELRQIYKILCKKMYPFTGVLNKQEL